MSAFRVAVALSPRQHGPNMIRRLLAPDAEYGQPVAKFEELLARLEQIVSDMETAELPLEKLLANYEEGMSLVKACGDRLADAEQKVEILSRAVSAEGGLPAAAPEEDKPAESKSDIRLF
jgi:exodeoxyribonuclease VII small subunit